MLDELRSTREQTRAFLEATKDRDLIAHHKPHPFLGTLNLLEMVSNDRFAPTAAYKTIEGDWQIPTESRRKFA